MGKQYCYNVFTIRVILYNSDTIAYYRNFNPCISELKDIHHEYLEKYLGDALHLSDEYSTNKEFIKGVLLSGVGTVLLQRNWDFVNKRLKKRKVFLTRYLYNA